MSRSDLANKYRPRKFSDVVGQGPTVASLRGVIERRSAVAYVLTGPSGVGKTTLARICAHALGCDSENIQEVDGATYSGVDHWKMLIENLRYVPLTGTSKMKVLIVDECHALSKAAWQSLLKAIEEPPPHVAWFFCTTEVAKVPATIMTRCARYDLQSVKPDDLYDLLVKVRDAEDDGGPSDKVLAMISRNSDGSPRQALTALAACWDAKDTEQAANLLRTAGESPEIVNICQGLVKGTLRWSTAIAILQGLEGPNPESLRITTLAYMTKVAMGAKTPESASRCCAILEAFATPYPAGNCLAPYILSLGRLLLQHGGDDAE